MPNHKTHDRIALATAPAIGWLTFFIVHDTIFSVGTTIAYIFASYFLSPDLDHDVGSKPYRRWGIFRFFWFPYMKAIKHRSWLSHSGPISATIRLTYILIPVTCVLYLLKYQIYIDDTIRLLLLLFYIAMIAADVIHTAADFIWKD